MFPVRCRVVRTPGLGTTIMPVSSGSNPVVYMSGGYNLQSLPGYVGNNPAVPTNVMNAFEMYKAAAPVQQQQPQIQVLAPPPVVQQRNNPGMHVALPREVLIAAREQQPVIKPPTPRPVMVPRKEYNVTPPAEMTAPSAPAPSSVPAAAAVAEPKKADTATVVGIGAAGILAALLFR